MTHPDVPMRTMSRWGWVLGGAAALLTLGLGLLVWRGSESGGIEDAWVLIFGPPDLGPIDFQTLRRRSTPNDALACPPDICAHAQPDIVPPIYPVSGDRLRRIIAEVALTDPDTQLVFSARWEDHDRYLARSRILRFPDTIDVLAIERDENQATLALYSRSQIGHGDLGVNRARIERWLSRIRARAAAG
jgi:uncharacterized protein (DUF1499 family)